MGKPRRRLTRDDWADAALTAIAKGGVDSVAVEPLAAKLGTTKGSFYWHFESRDALVDAALELWERRHTDAVIEFLAHEPDPARRLRTLVDATYERRHDERVEIALLANPSHKAARRVLQRVAERRLGYLTDQLEALGWSSEEARDRAILMGYVYVGSMQMSHVGANLADPKTRKRRVDLVFNTLVAGGVLPSSMGTHEGIEA